jgi:hypothetical protein
LTTTFTNRESALGTRNVDYGMWSVQVTGAAAFAGSTVPGDPSVRVQQFATATCTAVDAHGTTVARSIRIPQ